MIYEGQRVVSLLPKIGLLANAHVDRKRVNELWCCPDVNEGNVPRDKRGLGRSAITIILRFMHFGIFSRGARFLYHIWMRGASIGSAIIGLGRRGVDVEMRWRVWST